MIGNQPEHTDTGFILRSHFHPAWASSLTRNSFLRGCINLLWVMPLGAALKGLFQYLSYETPTSAVTQFGVGTADTLPSLPAYFENARVWLNEDAAGYFGIDAICTHLGCTVRLQPSGEEYRCPCHGSRFDLTGEVLQGPAVRPLPFYRLYWGSERQLTIDRVAPVDPSFRLPPVG